MKAFPESINLPAAVGGEKYIIVLSRDAIEEGIIKDRSEGKLIGPMPQPLPYVLMAAWVLAHEADLRRIAEQLRPVATGSGKRVWIHSEDLHAHG
ncbi:hypothetical protein [Sphingomonas sp. BAUL-RG-20F-R05-02]|uniref:hypothetical protein n=1 Tax=Sphingomonas sp. BAUL-RG-20F-R05-02 TaxID=2914830 RepID=UPI001F5A09C6|nr:hypothetical protein [Sphingomonas sp. BAUL-RG-20F-R05-02]